MKDKNRGKKDDWVWEHFEKTNGNIAKCKRCEAEFRGKPAANRLRNHLLGVPGSGIRICTQVVASSVSPSAPQHNNELENHGDNGDEMQAVLQRIGQQASDECAHEQIANSLYQSLNLVNNLSLTSALQQHCKFQDRVQDGERMQVDQEDFVVPENHGDIGDEMQAVLHECSDEVNNLFSTSALQQQSEFQNTVRDGERMQADQENFEGGGIRSYTLVPEHVKNALADASTSSKRPRIEPPSSINNNEFNNQGGNEQHTRGALQRMQEDLERSYTSAPVNTSALLDPVAEFQECMNGPDSRINETNNSASTSAPQQNNESDNQMQADQEVVGGADQESSAMPESSGDGEPFPTEKLVGATFKKDMDTVLEWLMSDEVSSIGIYGMGGVGKTTLLTHVYNRILEDKSKFGDVYWITVSQNFNIERLQNLIAKSIGLDFRNEEDFKKRAAKLSKELRRNHKFVLILDDLWNHFDVKKMGIPTEVNGCKVIVTTRSLEVCRRINCQEKLKVQPLLENEAWKLFLETLGHDLAPGVEQIARSIVGECAGLPLGIVAMAGSMRQEDDIHVWENALTELQKSKVRAGDMEDEVFKILRFSYARLNETALQECLLYCALYPEDFTIEKKELIEHLIVEGIIERMDSRKQAINKGYTMLNTLENFCLLERSYGGGVKMHDLIRDMAIQIMQECSPSLVKAGEQLICLPEKTWWTENIVRVSLMDNDIGEISSHYSPRCPNLSTLILSNNERMQSIAEPFFYELHGLKVLNLSETGIKKLPESLGDSENLKALILRNCQYLTSLPSLRKLEALEKLDLYRCEKFEKVPEGLESSVNLNYLDLLFTQVKDLPAGILTNLSHLQYLGFYGSSSRNVKGEEIGRLLNLETLFWRFNDGDDFNNYIHSLSNMHAEKQQRSRFIHVVGPVFSAQQFPNLKHDYDEKRSFFVDCNLSGEVLLPTDIKELTIFGVTIHNGRSLCLKNAINLEGFNIQGCEEIEYLSSSPSIFQTLEILRVCKMEKLMGLFSKDGDDGIIPSTPLPIATFSRLRNLTIRECRSMKKLFPYALLSNLQNLQGLEIRDCSNMDEIIAADEEEGSNSHSILTHPPFTLPNLERLELIKLPKLKSICNVKLKCDSLNFVRITQCTKLKKIPVCLDNTIISSLECIEVHSQAWWASVEWDHPNNKAALRPIVRFDEMIGHDGNWKY